MNASWQRHCFRTAHALRHYAGSRRLWDIPILETPSFVVVPTVGPLVEGWLLVVPKKPVISFAQVAIADFTELDALVAQTVALVEGAYGPAAIFEHGPATSNSRIGCGVDYAHMHIVPTQCNMLCDAQAIAPNIDWSAVDSLTGIHRARTDDYWFLQQNYYSDSCYLGHLAYGQPPSQLFRQVIASSIGRPNAYDWKQDLHEELVAAAVERLARRTVPE